MDHKFEIADGQITPLNVTHISGSLAPVQLTQEQILMAINSCKLFNQECYAQLSNNECQVLHVVTSNNSGHILASEQAGVYYPNLNKVELPPTPSKSACRLEEKVNAALNEAVQGCEQLSSAIEEITRSIDKHGDSEAKELAAEQLVLEQQLEADVNQAQEEAATVLQSIVTQETIERRKLLEKLREEVREELVSEFYGKDYKDYQEEDNI